MDESMDEMEMWQAWWLLNSVRSWVAKEVDGLEFPDISYLWKGQRGSWQKAA